MKRSARTGPAVKRTTRKKTTAIAAVAAVAGALGTAAVPAGAEQARQPPNAPMILNLLSRPLESPEVAFNKELRNDIAAPAAKNSDTEVLADGSVRYGKNGKSVTVTIRNPCPPGDIEHEMAQLSPYRPLPGRGPR
jgi:hypothetical protein